MELDKIDKDILMEIALGLDMPELLKLCLTSKRINGLICNNKLFWLNKVKRNYPKTYIAYFKKDTSPDWKSIYEKIYKISKGDVEYIPLYKKSIADRMREDLKWRNPSDLKFNDASGWSLRKDKKDSSIVYLYPSSYYHFAIPYTYINGVGTKLPNYGTPKEGENHPKIMLKITFPQIKIEEIEWNPDVLGENLHYRRGDGVVSWYDDMYQTKITYDGSNRNFKTELINVKID